jgi:hypothetical protein
MYCGDNRHLVESCPRQLKAALGLVVINPFKDDKGKGTEQEEEESGNI